MARKKREPVTIDLNDPDVMDWVNEMRESRPSAAERRKINSWTYYHRHKEERAKSALKWREKHLEHYLEKQKEYHSRPEVLGKKRETARLRYHTDREWRETLLEKQKARYHAMTDEQRAEYNRKQRERARIRRAKARAAKEAKEAK